VGRMGDKDTVVRDGVSFGSPATEDGGGPIVDIVLKLAVLTWKVVGDLDESATMA